MTDNYGFGYQKRRQGNFDMLDGTETFRDGFQKMVNSWTVSIPETISILKKHIKLDPHFHDFARWAKINSVPIVVLSAGMAPIIRALLDEFLGELASNIEIVANDVQPIPPLNDPAEALPSSTMMRVTLGTTSRGQYVRTLQRLQRWQTASEARYCYMRETESVT